MGEGVRKGERGEEGGGVYLQMSRKQLKNHGKGTQVNLKKKKKVNTIFLCNSLFFFPFCSLFYLS